jgi:hypothetical protein
MRMPLDARLMTLIDGRWVIEVSSGDSDLHGFIVALSTQSIKARVIGGAIILEVEPKEK